MKFEVVDAPVLVRNNTFGTTRKYSFCDKKITILIVITAN
jgi:hypothetical protein